MFVYYIFFGKEVWYVESLDYFLDLVVVLGFIWLVKICEDIIVFL